MIRNINLTKRRTRRHKHKAHAYCSKGLRIALASTKLLLFLCMCKKTSIFAIKMRRNTYIYIVLSALLLILWVLDLCCGSVWLNPVAHLHGWAGGLSIEQQILFHIRLPKSLTAIMAGAALSVAGLTMQTLFRNPLAGPYTLGVSSGASLGVAFATMCASLAGFGGAGGLSSVLSAIVGSTLILLLVMLVARRVKSNVSLLIVGMMFGSIAGAIVNVLQNFANPDALKLFIVWTFGSLDSVGWAEMAWLAPVWIVGMGLCVALIKPLNGLLMGEDYARGLGVDIARTRLLIVVSTGLLAGGITAFCGPIAFIGVAVPHIARGILHTSNHRLTLPASALIGADMLLVCDLLCSLFTYPLPISTVSALFGAPIIIRIIIKGNK